MINLLPPDRAQAIRYGRLNAVLRQWLVWLALAIIGLIVILAGGWLYINQQSKNYQQDINSSNAQLASQNLPKIQKDADEISGDLKVVNQVLSKEVRFSDLLQAIGQVMPSGTILDTITLTSVQGALDLSANTKDSTSAAQIAVNLSDPKNDLFSKVDIVNIDCNSTTPTYKCKATYKALFSKSAQTRFLSVAKASP